MNNGDGADRVTVGRQALARFCRERRLALGLLTASLGMALVSAAFPVAVAYGVDAATRSDRRAVWTLAVTAVAIGVVVWALNWIRVHLARRLIARTVLELRLDLLRCALRGGLDLHDRYPRSTLLSRATHELDEFGESVFRLLELAQQVIVVALLLPLMLVLDWRLTILTLLCGALIILVGRVFRRYTAASAARAAADAGAVSSLVQELTAGLRVIQSYRAQDLLDEAVGRANRAAAASWHSAMTRAALLMPIMAVLVGLAMAGVVWGGGLLVGAAVIGVSAWYLFVVAADRISWTLSSAGALEAQVQQAAANAARVFEILDRDERPGTLPGEEHSPRRPAARAVELSLDQVRLRYHNGTEALRGVSLRVPAGSRIGLVGRSGTGKSSLIKAVAGLHPLAGGAVLLDGMPLPRWPEPELRRVVAYLPQRPQLFSGTLADNLRLTRPTATDDDLLQLIHRAGLADWLATLPGGLRADVGPGGAGLSAGQRQIVGILRALVKEPGLVLLDEPAAHLDSSTEKHLREAMWSLLDQATCLVIAHRLDTVRELDLLVLLDAGRIVEQGTHDELLNADGTYAALHADHLVGAIRA
ncbi:ABC transporter ATP-binding protein [Micromonospora zingiberis]|uniref:ABC transporter ATP-binding protein n=1 Tax=Micromonospora zingiberis TaxID=2053011 RepID=A0A4R0GUP1_9ACTN|nr:ABC transporter ATP-binding protein [Micromonospora zingiberis]TCB99659.1 ABC transporter ATP-binding protein [Micromonospora zingiberis]